MKKVIIRNTDLEVSPINFGGNVFGWTLDEQIEAHKLVDLYKVCESGVLYHIKLTAVLRSFRLRKYNKG